MPYGAHKCQFFNCGRFDPEDDVRCVMCQYCTQVFYACYTCRKYTGCINETVICRFGRTAIQLMEVHPLPEGREVNAEPCRTDFTEFWISQYSDGRNDA